MALGAKLIAATLILGASTVGTYAIANGGLGGLSSGGDSSTSGAGETGNQKAVPEAPVKGEGSASTGEASGLRQGQEPAPDAAGVRAEPAPNVDTPQIQSQPVPTGGPEAKGDGTTVDNRVAQGEEAGRAAAILPGTPPVDTEESPQGGSPVPAETSNKGSEETVEQKDVIQEQGPGAVVSNVEAEVASDAGHNSAEGATVQQQPVVNQGNNLEGKSHDGGPAADESQHRSTDGDGVVQNNPTNTPAENNGETGQGIKVEEVPGNTDPNKGGSVGVEGPKPQDADSGSTQLETTTPEVGVSQTPSNQTNNEQDGTSLGTQDSQHSTAN